MLKKDFYSNLIQFLKITLPIIAIIMLGTLFLLPDNRTKIQAYENIDQSTLEIVKKAGISKPSFRGTLASGSNLELHANEIIPIDKKDNVIHINEIKARLELNKDFGANAYAKKGIINIEEQIANLVDGVTIRGFNDIEIETTDLKVDYNKSIAKSNNPVFMNGKFGTIKAGAAKFYDKSDSVNIGYVLLFSNGVKMRYNFGSN